MRFQTGLDPNGSSQFHLVPVEPKFRPSASLRGVGHVDLPFSNLPSENRLFDVLSTRAMPPGSLLPPPVTSPEQPRRRRSTGYNLAAPTLERPFVAEEDRRLTALGICECFPCCYSPLVRRWLSPRQLLMAQGCPPRVLLKLHYSRSRCERKLPTRHHFAWLCQTNAGTHDAD